VPIDCELHWMPTVLNAGTQDALLNARAAALQQAGHAVVRVVNEIDLIDACKRTRFHVAVIGQCVATMPKHRILTVVREHCPKALVLELYTAREGQSPKGADEWLQVSSDSVAEELVERVTALAQRRPRRRRA
jgi:hypothetical protein